MISGHHKILFLIFLFIITQVTSSATVSLKMNNYYIDRPNNYTERKLWIRAAEEFCEKVRKDIEKTNIDAWRIYDRADLQWVSRNFTSRMCMMFDSDFYDPNTNEYLIDSVLAEGEKQFGGYGSIILWHAYPRLGIDERNQFDMYREMPGGLDSIRQIVNKCHSKGVRVFIDYNPWDTGTRRENKDDFQVLADIVAAIDADGVFLDTLSAGSPKLRAALDKVKPGIALVSEGQPESEQLSICSGSWAQWFDELEKGGILKLRWIEPRHMQYQIRRWDRSRSNEIATAFFNSSGMLIWENIFGTYNPWELEDRRDWKRANIILHFFADVFIEGRWQPYYPAEVNDVYINSWSKKTMTVYILINCGRSLQDEILFEAPFSKTCAFYDVWNGNPIKPEIKDETAHINSSLDRLGCIVKIEQGRVDADFLQLLEKMRKLKEAETATADTRNFAKPIVYADKQPRTTAVDRDSIPDGMVFVPGGVVTLEIEHIRRECGCYPNQAIAKAKDDGFGYGLAYGAVYPRVIHEPIKHKIGPIEINPFFIDETEVTNTQYKRFIDSSGYKPRCPENFLKHWPNGKMPKELAEHPVVYVDIDDARAYAKWARKRLPTEEEWQLVAQGLDGRKWPWGNTFDPNRCNTIGTHTLPVKSYPEGKSPYGCYHMSGNVWEWTESCRDDGHTRFVMIRGGSYFNAEGSIWYVKGGPQPCGHHTKFVRIWPGLDRCSTVGFRCVADAK